MQVKNRIVSIGGMVLGLLFLLNSGSDIQLGFGFVLFLGGAYAWQ